MFKVAISFIIANIQRVHWNVSIFCFVVKVKLRSCSVEIHLFKIFVFHRADANVYSVQRILIKIMKYSIESLTRGKLRMGVFIHADRWFVFILINWIFYRGNLYFLIVYWSENYFFSLYLWWVVTYPNGCLNLRQIWTFVQLWISVSLTFTTNLNFRMTLYLYFWWHSHCWKSWAWMHLDLWTFWLYHDIIILINIEREIFLY